MLDLVDKQLNTENLNAARQWVEAIAEKHNLVINPTGITLNEYLTLAKGEFPHSVKMLELVFNFDSIIVTKFVHQQGQLTATQAITEHNCANTELLCLSCTRTRFYLSVHFISLSEIGEVNDISKFEAKIDRIPSKEFKNDLRESDIHVLANDLIDRIKRFGMFLFNLEEVNPNLNRQVENLFFPNKDVAINYMKMVANKAEEIFTKESRVLSLTSPCYIFGDIHGNLKDLLIYSQNIWKTSPFVNQSKFLFLGDYVDRGSYGVECIIYLFCMKILAPNNFFLLRGNHEVREIQEQFSFQRECDTRYNDELWEIINMAFDRLPLVAIMDEKVFCAHGGIPVSVNTIAQIRSITSPLDNPLLQSIEAWEILWNDPISKVDFDRLSAFEQNFSLQTNGFSRNIKRGTAMMYTDLAVQQFLKRNHLDQVIRAHEVFEEGFCLHLQGEVLTVFSSSKYVDLNNRSGILFLDGHQIRIIQMQPE